MQSKWMLRFITALVWALAAASAAYWALRLGEHGKPVMLAPTGSDSNALLAGADGIARFLGPGQPASAPVVAAASRFTLEGVAMQGPRGVALLRVDSKPARPYTVGALIDGDTRLLEVGTRYAVLASGKDAENKSRLELPALPAGATAGSQSSNVGARAEPQAPMTAMVGGAANVPGLAPIGIAPGVVPGAHTGSEQANPTVPGALAGEAAAVAAGPAARRP